MKKILEHEQRQQQMHHPHQNSKSGTPQASNSNYILGSHLTSTSKKRNLNEISDMTSQIENIYSGSDNKQMSRFRKTENATKGSQRSFSKSPSKVSSRKGTPSKLATKASAIKNKRMKLDEDSQNSRSRKSTAQIKNARKNSKSPSSLEQRRSSQRYSEDNFSPPQEQRGIRRAVKQPKPQTTQQAKTRRGASNGTNDDMYRQQEQRSRGASNPQVVRNIGTDVGKKPSKISKSSIDSIYSKSYQYKSNNRGDRYKGKSIDNQNDDKPSARGRGSKSGSMSMNRKSQSGTVKAPVSQTIRPERAARSRVQSSQVKRTTAKSTSIIPKEKRIKQLMITESEIRGILDMYFDYVIDNLPPRIKIKEIIIGKFLKKVTYEKQKQIEIKVSNINFLHNKNARKDKEGSIDKQKIDNNNQHDKNFKICDIIDFTYNRNKHHPNLYLIREIIIILDFSGKQKIEKQDESLPDIEINFKTHPLIQRGNLNNFKEAKVAVDEIKTHIDEDFFLDNHGVICLFEVGHRQIRDDRLQFEKFIHNLQQIQKSYQHQLQDEALETALKLCKSSNSLNASAHYEKKFIVQYGYKFEEPKQIYQIIQEKNDMPIELKIRRWDDNTQKMITASKSEYQISSSQKKSLRVGYTPATSGGLGDALVKNQQKSNRSFESSAKLSASGSEEEYKKDSQSSQEVNEMADIEQRMKKKVVKTNDTIEELPSETQSENSLDNNDQIANVSENRSKSVPTMSKKSVTKLKSSKNYPEKSDQLQGRTYKVAPRVPENVESSDDQSNISRQRRSRNRKIKDDESSNKSFGNKSASSMTKTISDNDSMGGGKVISSRRNTRHMKRNQVSTIIEENEADVSMKDEDASDNQTTRSRGAKQGKFILQRRNDESESEEDVAEDDGMSQISHVIGAQGLSQFEKDKSMFDNEYDEACNKLQLNSIPKELPCRDQEREIIRDYLKQGIMNKGSSSSLYISGMPGTGKTATTLEIMRQFIQKKKNFEFIHINAMSLTNPNLVYTILAEKIIQRRLNPQSAALFLDEFFKKKDKKQIVLKHMSRALSKNTKKQNDEAQKICDKIRVLLVDELDALITPKQTLLYNLFEWPCNQNSRLLVISIANTMDLPERLQGKIKSRMGNNRLVYEPYTTEQIERILNSRLKDINIFQSKGIHLVAKKVSQYSGDIRRSLQITKRAVEICREKWIAADKQKQVLVTPHEITEAFDDMQKSKTVQVLKGLRKLEVLVVIALFLELRQSRQEKVLMDRVQDRCENLIKSLKENRHNLFDDDHQDVQYKTKQGQEIRYNNWKITIFSTTIFREIVKRLQAFGLINLMVESHKLVENTHMQLYIYFDELRNAFEHNEIYMKEREQIEKHGN